MSDEHVDPYELRAAMHRVIAGRLRLEAAKHDMAAKTVLTTRSMKRFYEVMVAADAQDVADHPDLAELNAQMRGFYEEPGDPPA